MTPPVVYRVFYLYNLSLETVDDCEMFWLTMTTPVKESLSPCNTAAAARQRAEVGAGMDKDVLMLGATSFILHPNLALNM